MEGSSLPEVTFRAIWVAPSIILSLGITRVCSDCVSIIRSRGTVRLHWLPFTWAAAIFVWQVQYLWAIIELPHIIATWTLAQFLALLLLSLCLFFAAAMVLPDHELSADESFIHQFQKDGRLSLIALSLWAFVGVAVDTLMFSQTFDSLGITLMLIIGVLPLLYFCTHRRGAKGAVSVLYLLLTLVTAWVQSPKSY